MRAMQNRWEWWIQAGEEPYGYIEGVDYESEEYESLEQLAQGYDSYSSHHVELHANLLRTTQEHWTAG